MATLAHRHHHPTFHFHFDRTVALFVLLFVAGMVVFGAIGAGLSYATADDPVFPQEPEPYLQVEEMPATAPTGLSFEFFD